MECAHWEKVMYGNETMRQQMDKMEIEIKNLKNGDVVMEMKEL